LLKKDRSSFKTGFLPKTEIRIKSGFNPYFNFLKKSGFEASPIPGLSRIVPSGPFVSSIPGVFEREFTVRVQRLYSFMTVLGALGMLKNDIENGQKS
jgi:hypothetical protein